MAGAPPSGFGSGLESILSSPLVQTALAGYLGAVGSPRNRGIGGALSQGGLSGLEAFNASEQLKTQLPLEQAQAQLAQQQVPLAKQQQQLGQQQIQLGQKRLQPMSPDISARLEAYKTTATDPEERNFIGLIQAQAQQGLIGPEDVDKALESFDENKRLMELYKGQAAQYQASIAPAILNQMYPGMALPPPPGGAMPAGSAPTPGMGTAGAGAPPNLSSLAPGTTTKMDIPGKGAVDVAKDTDGKSYYLEGGAWKPIS